MAKICMCDVCYKVGKLTEAAYKIGRKSASQKVAIDVCEEHKGVFDGMDVKQALNKAIEIYSE